jgi:hypothetical protein
MHASLTVIGRQLQDNFLEGKSDASALVPICSMAVMLMDKPES